MPPQIDPGRPDRKPLMVALSVILIAALCAAAWGGYKLWEVRQEYARGDESYEGLRALAVHQEQAVIDTDTDEEGEAAAQTPLVEIPFYAIDFDALKQVNADTAAWLYCPDTPIDYPVMGAEDYNWYLHHLPDGTYNKNGSLFLDYNGPSDFSGGLSIIYGHNMKSGKMFSSLTEYKKQAYFEQHPCMYLYTPQGNYRVDLLYGCVIGEGEWRNRAFMFEANLDALLSYAEANTTFDSGVSYVEGDRIIALSTCTYEFDDARYFVLGILRPAIIENRNLD